MFEWLRRVVGPAPGTANEGKQVLQDLPARVSSAKPGLMPAKRPLPPGVDARPLLVYMEQAAYAVLISEASSLSTYWAPTASTAISAIGDQPFVGVVALSPISESGQACAVIEAVRAANPDALTVYHGWDYRIEISGAVALKCKADVLVLGGIETNELFALLMNALRLKAAGKLPTPSLAWYEEALRQLCPKSAFWASAKMFREKGVPPSKYE